MSRGLFSLTALFEISESANTATLLDFVLSNRSALVAEINVDCLINVRRARPLTSNLPSGCVVTRSRHAGKHAHGQTSRPSARRALDNAVIALAANDGDENHPDEVYLTRIEIHPDYQGQGVDAHLVHQLLSDARDRDQPVVLDVLAVNERALAFYLRHGFREVTRHGPDEIKVRLRSL